MPFGTLVNRALAVIVCTALTASLVVAIREPARAAALCGTPGRDGSPSVAGVVNTYFPGSANAAAGATTITVGAHATGDANTAIASGDLLLVIQMQGATLNTSNSPSYGDGSGSGSGATSTSAGAYEYVVAQSGLVTTGGTVTIKGTGAGNGLINGYTATGNGRFQVIRVPQYLAPSIGAGLVPLGWNGTAGGVLAIDVQNNLDGAGSTISADGLGFRGGGARQLTGDPTAGNGDWVNSNATNAHAEKGEGTAGTPTYTYDSSTATLSGAGTADGYTGGDMGRGAPGNAGGGGADANAVVNDQNTGGGGGGNGGAGGEGGKSWSSNIPYGGKGGTFAPSATKLVMGGGGGAGVRNNSSGAMSSGGSGGAIVMMRVGGVVNALTITANGMMGVEPQNDGGGGGGAGGSIAVTSLTALGGITATANGANGTNADVLNAGNAAHGPGGGGGGGVVVQSGGVTATVNGGNAGITDGSPTPDAHYGAAAGATGQTFSMPYNAVPGASSGAECGSSATTGLLIGPVGAPNATGSYDGNVAVTNNNDFVEKSFAPVGFNAVNSSTVIGSPNGNAYTSAVNGISLRHQVHNYGGGTTVNFFAQAPTGWTVSVYTDNAGALGVQIAGTASANTYQTTATITVGGGADYFVWTVYNAPSGIQAFNRFDGLLTVTDAGNTTNNNAVHDEMYSGYVVQTKSYTITSTGCGGSVPAGTWCPGGILQYTIDVRNIAVAASGTTPSSATLTAGNLTLTDDGSNTNSWAKDGGYLNTPGASSTGTAPTTVTYYYNATSSTTFPVNYNTTNKVFKVTANWPTLTAGQNSQLIFSAVQF